MTPPQTRSWPRHLASHLRLAPPQGVALGAALLVAAWLADPCFGWGGPARDGVVGAAWGLVALAGAWLMGIGLVRHCTAQTGRRQQSGCPWRALMWLAPAACAVSPILVNLARPLHAWWCPALMSAALLAALALAIRSAIVERIMGLWCTVLGLACLLVVCWSPPSDAYTLLATVLSLLLTSLAVIQSERARSQAAAALPPEDEPDGATESVGSMKWCAERVDTAATARTTTVPAGPLDAECRVQDIADLRPNRPAASGLRVLVADDNAMIRALLQRIVSQAGHTVVAVENGAQAVEAIGREQIDIVLMDVSMPVMSGNEAARAMRVITRQPGQPRLGIIGISGHAMPGDDTSSLASGMDHYLTKPIRRETLLDALSVVAARMREPQPPR